MHNAMRMLALCLASAGLAAYGADDGGNGAPTANSFSISTAEDTAVTGSFSGTDPDGDALTASIATAPGKGDVSISTSSPLSFTYTPRTDQNGTDTFTYTVLDGSTSSAPATVTVTIEPRNDAPVIISSLAADEDQPLTTMFVTDPEGDAVTVEVTTPPAHGTISADATTPGRFTYTAAPEFSGTDSVVLLANDESLDSGPVSQTVTITVSAINDAPVANADEVYTNQGTSAQFVPLANDVDPEGDALTVTITRAPGNGTATVNADGSIQYTPDTGFTGFTSLDYQITDGGASATSTMSIGVGQRWGVLYEEAPNELTARQLYYADDGQRFLVNAPLAPTERISSAVTAKTAPIVYYSTNDGTTARLYRADLTNPGNVTEIEHPTGGPGVEAYAINADGSKVAYNYGGQLKFSEVGATATTHVLDTTAGSALTLNPSGSSVIYAKGSAPALYSVNTSGAPAPVQITSTAPTNAEIKTLHLSVDERRLVYSIRAGNTRLIRQVNPAVPLSDSLLLDGTAINLDVVGSAAAGSIYYGRTAIRPPGDTLRAHAHYLDVRYPGFATKLTGQNIGQILDLEMTDDAKRFYYIRSNGDMASNASLYGVTRSDPTVVDVVARHNETTYGVQTFTVAHSGQNLLYTTLHQDRSGVTQEKLYFLDVSTPGATSVNLHQFRAFAKAVGYAPDDSFTIVSGHDAAGMHPFDADIYVVQMPGRQLVKVSTALARNPKVVLRP